MGLLFSNYKSINKTENYSTEVTVDNTMSPAAIGKAEEIRDKIEKHIVLQTTIQDNIVNGTMYAFMPNTNIDSVHFHLRFKLNGKDFHIAEKISREDYEKGPGRYESNSIESKKNFIEIVSPYIAKIISVDFLKELDKQHGTFNNSSSNS